MGCIAIFFFAWRVNEDLSLPPIRESTCFSVFRKLFSIFRVPWIMQLITRHLQTKDLCGNEFLQFLFFNFSVSKARKLNQFAYSTSSQIEDWEMTTNQLPVNRWRNRSTAVSSDGQRPKISHNYRGRPSFTPVSFSAHEGERINGS